MPNVVLDVKRVEMENSAYEERKQALIEEITAVFDGVERGDGTTFYEGTALDNGGLPEKRAAARAKDTEKRWQDVPSQTFLENYSAISFLNPQGFRYYIPALMVWYLRFRDVPSPEQNSNLFDSIIFHLRKSEGSLEDYHLARFQALTIKESNVVSRFLQFEAETARREAEEYILRDKQDLMDQGRPQFEIDNLEASGFWLDDAQKALNSYWAKFL